MNDEDDSASSYVGSDLDNSFLIPIGSLVFIEMNLLLSRILSLRMFLDYK